MVRKIEPELVFIFFIDALQTFGDIFHDLAQKLDQLFVDVIVV